MAHNFTRQMDSTGGERVCHRLQRTPTTKILMPIVPHEQRAGESFRSRGCGNGHKEGNRGSQSSGNAFHQPNVRSTLERRQMEASPEPEVAEPVCEENTFQNGRHQEPQGYPPGERLHGQVRLAGSVFLHPNGREKQEILAIQVEKEMLSVHLPTIRPQQCSLRFYKATQTSSDLPEGAGDPLPDVYRRHADPRENSGGAQPQLSHLQVSPHVTGVCGERGEISGRANTGAGISGFSHQLKVHDPHSNNRKAEVTDISMQAFDTSSMDDNSTSGPDNWYNDVTETGDPPSEMVDRTSGSVEVKPIRSSKPVMTLESDASNLGWGAVRSAPQDSTSGVWNRQERSMHINSKELLAAWLGLRCYASNMRSSHIHLRIDNTTAVAHINKMGGTHSWHLCQLAIKVWNWCLDRRITISAEHLPGSLNQLADTESRAQADSSEWALDLAIFQQLMAKRGPCTVDLFASRLSAKLPTYYSWRSDPGAAAIDALCQSWNVVKGYAFPPFCLIGRCLAKIKLEKVPRLVLIAPLWKSQAWFPLLPEMSVEKPILLPSCMRLLTDPMGFSHPMVIQGHLQLVAWTVSGVLSRVEDFQRKLLRSSVLHGESTQKPHTLVVGGFGQDGAQPRVSIPLIHLSRLWLNFSLLNFTRENSTAHWTRTGHVFWARTCQLTVSR